VSAHLGLPRAYARQLIQTGHVLVDNAPAKAATRVKAGQEIEVRLPTPSTPPAQEIPILYEDEWLVVVNKPAGLPVHPPSPHSPAPSLVGLLGRERDLEGGPPERPGVVHRLDALTSGAMVLAKTKGAYASLVDQFRHRQVKKEYLALVEGELEANAGEIRGRIGRHPRRPWRMRVSPGGKDAHTEFQVLARGQGQSLLLVRPRTGRTHQIRLHLAAIGHPVVGDPIYGQPADHMFLHSWRLGFQHPETGEWLELFAPPPTWFSPWAQALARHLKANDRADP